MPYIITAWGLLFIFPLSLSDSIIKSPLEVTSNLSKSTGGSAQPKHLLAVRLLALAEIHETVRECLSFTTRYI